MWGDVDRDELMRVWGEELARFTGEDIAAAIKAMPASYQEYPPTLPQFASLCSDSKRARVAGAMKLTGPRVPMPDHIRKQLEEFVAKSKQP
jgi:hypothetical protein